jgi:hypothetical protein
MARKKVVLQLRDLFKLLEIEHTTEAERLAQTILNFLAYLAPEDSLITPWHDFHKIADNLVVIESRDEKTLGKIASDSLDIKRIISLPY